MTATSIVKSYGTAMALTDANVSIDDGEVVALVGASGSGKTTLLYCLAALLAPDRGTIEFEGRSIAGLDYDDAADLRRQSFGFVFQFAELVPELTIAENVQLPLDLIRMPGRAARSRVRELLDRLGIGDLSARKPGDVSGGQAQRAAVARSLAHRPKVVFADEPTGALDSVNGQTVLEALMELARDEGSSVVLVTHDEKVASACDRQVYMHDGVCHNLRLPG